MTNVTVISFEERIEKAAKILKITNSELLKILESIGVDSLEVLDSTEIYSSQIADELRLNANIPMLKAMAVGGILKDSGVKKVENKEPENSTIKALLEATKPIASWTDQEVLEGYIESSREDLESELQRRSRGRRFIVLQEGSKTDIDVLSSLRYLKRARKEEIPSSIRDANNKYTRIYKVEEYHPENRIRYESPLRPGVILFDGYCAVSKLNFSNVSDPAQKMLRLIHNDLGSMSTMDEAYLVDVATKEGSDGLARMYPEIHDNYMDLAMADRLPSLKVVAPLDTKLKLSDPFFTNHKTY